MTDARKVIVVTGASAGIGAATARALDVQGHRLVLAARRSDELALVARACREAIAVACDVTKRSEVERLRDRALESFGRVDVWINNVGRGISRSVLALTDDDVDEMVTVNVKSALYGMQAIVPHFQARNDGQIINVSSFLGRVPLATIRSAYSAMKAALNSLTANLRVDLAASHPGVSVTLVMPGLVSTEFASNALGGAPSAGAFRPPPGSPMAPQTAEEVAQVIARVIEVPVAEVYTNPQHAKLAARYVDDVAAFEAELRARTAP